MTAPGSASPPSVERIVLGQTDPNVMLASCHDAIIRVFDVRNNRAPVLQLQPFRQPPVGIVYEPNGRPNLLVAASERGDMCFIDIRMASRAGSPPPPPPGPGTSSPSPQQQPQQPGGGEFGGGCGVAGGGQGVLRLIPAHSKGGLSVLAAHHHAPLIATGTVNQVVKVWNDQGEAVSVRLAGMMYRYSHPHCLCCSHIYALSDPELWNPPSPSQVGAIRAQASFLSQKAGPVTCMSFHPYQPLLAAAGIDSVCTVYAIDNNPSGSTAGGGGSTVGSLGPSRVGSTLPSLSRNSMSGWAPTPLPAVANSGSSSSCSALS